jgi:molecular chaperone DnaK
MERQGKTAVSGGGLCDILLKMKEIPETRLTDTVTEAVVMMPVGFTTGSSRPPKDATGIAMLTFLRVINESPEATTVFTLNETNESEHNFLIFDFGVVRSISRC